VFDLYIIPFRFDFFSLDKKHVMAVARGPLNDAIDSYKAAAWQQPQKHIQNQSPSYFTFEELQSNNNLSGENCLPVVEFKTFEQLLPEKLLPLLPVE
jgi:hypothetical protein